MGLNKLLRGKRNFHFSINVQRAICRHDWTVVFHCCR